jgi:hypothetical protein
VWDGLPLPLHVGLARAITSLQHPAHDGVVGHP